MLEPLEVITEIYAIHSLGEVSGPGKGEGVNKSRLMPQKHLRLVSILKKRALLLISLPESNRIETVIQMTQN